MSIDELYIDCDDPEDVMPCQCVCGEWFDHSDGRACFTCNDLTCIDCHDMEEQECKKCIGAD